MAETTLVSPKRLAAFFETRLGETIFLNADDRNPSTLKAVFDDYLELSSHRIGAGPKSSFIIPFTSIVSIQETEGIQGLILYLVR